MYSLRVFDWRRCAYLAAQILSITCDNALANYEMIKQLALLVDAFPGETNRTRCFAHILNLIAKSLLKQFDVPKKKADEALSDMEKELEALAEGLEFDSKEGVEDMEGADDIDGLVNEVALMSDDECNTLQEATLPVRLVLVKVALTFVALSHSHPAHFSSYPSSARLHSRSYTRRHSCCQRGRRSSKT